MKSKRLKSHRLCLSKVEAAARKLYKYPESVPDPIDKWGVFQQGRMSGFWGGYTWLCDWLSRQKKKTVKEVIVAARKLKEVP